MIETLVTLNSGSWSEPHSKQYHIQTDEGPERYFKYQTDNGQYRKEKRLQDGTVIGVDAWIDAAGYLRQKDYIADNKGYRILKSKTVFVGQGRPIDEAMNFAKYSPAPDNAIPGVVRQVVSTPAPIVVSSTAAPIALTATPSPIAITTYRPAFYSTTSTTTTTTQSPISSTIGYTPSAHHYVKNVFIRPHSEPRDHLYDHHFSFIAPNDLNNNLLDVTSREYSTVKPPSLEFELPHNEITSGSTLHPPIAKYTDRQFSTTVRPLHSSPVESTTYRPSIRASIADSYRPTPIGVSTARPLIESESVSRPFYSNNYKYYAPSYTKNGIDSYKPYDGVSLTNNDGFKYYLPRQYHEEEGQDQYRDGSFGYIDPFGIRRVVYYNVRPGTGFVHRKNNRYVGFNATPYDPRPSSLNTIRKKK
uniref:CSON009679 protein n=1 Tax=Culicoides sonorensis TaxID=179676 RepID=A0A336KF43_CULSO